MYIYNIYIYRGIYKWEKLVSKTNIISETEKVTFNLSYILLNKQNWTRTGYT